MPTDRWTKKMDKKCAKCTNKMDRKKMDKNVVHTSDGILFTLRN